MGNSFCTVGWAYPVRQNSREPTCKVIIFAKLKSTVCASLTTCRNSHSTKQSAKAYCCGRWHCRLQVHTGKIVIKRSGPCNRFFCRKGVLLFSKQSHFCHPLRSCSCLSGLVQAIPLQRLPWQLTVQHTAEPSPVCLFFLRSHQQCPTKKNTFEK